MTPTANVLANSAFRRAMTTAMIPRAGRPRVAPGHQVGGMTLTTAAERINEDRPQVRVEYWDAGRRPLHLRPPS
jgi:hypothetical protein